MTRLQELQSKAERVRNEKPVIIPFEATKEEALALSLSYQALMASRYAAMDAVIQELVNQISLRTQEVVS